MSNLVKIRQHTIDDVSGEVDVLEHWSEDAFKRLDISHLSHLNLDFDVIGVDASIANAIRRVMIAEVPTLAAERVWIFANDSVVQDEILSHRIGLLPIHFPDVDRFNMQKDWEHPSEEDTVLFTIDVRCKRNPTVPKPKPNEVVDPEKVYENANVVSGMFAWKAAGSQTEWWKDDPPRMINDNILLTKLRPGQAVRAEIHCVLGIGQDHAKFSPVATASYRLMPSIKITKQPESLEARQKFISCFPEGVCELDKDGKIQVVNPRADTVTREVLRHEEFKDSVELGRIRDHFIFSVESTGQRSAPNIVIKALDVLMEKIDAVEAALDQLEHM